MKIFTLKKSTLAVGVFVATLLATTQVLAYHGTCRAKSPVAVCEASVNSNIQIPRYVCCELYTKKGHHIWRNTWVSGSCSNANPYAQRDVGCDIDSPVYGTGMPIQATCQFSASTGKYL